MASGKQILLSSLIESSQKFQKEGETESVSEELKAGLLLHGSTASFMWKMVEKLGWINQRIVIDEEVGDIEKQGLGLAKQNVLLSVIFEKITDNEHLLETVKSDYPAIEKEDLEAAIHIIWLLLKSLEWSKNTESVEDNGKLDLKEKEHLINSYKRKLNDYREDPEDYS